MINKTWLLKPKRLQSTRSEPQHKGEKFSVGTGDKVQTEPLGRRHEPARWVGRAHRKGSLEKGNRDSKGSCIPGGGDLWIKAWL